MSVSSGTLLKKITAALSGMTEAERLAEREEDLRNLRENIKAWECDPACHHLLGEARLRVSHLVREVERLTEVVK